MVENINSLEYGNSQEAAELCVALRGNNFKRNSQVESGLDDILATIGASKRFRLQPCNVNNASAVTILGIRYILYDIDFMNSISNGSSWGNTFILAHEVGHHINGHTMDAALHSLDIIDPTSLSDLRTQELEADEFAGFVLAKLGGPLSAAKETITSISNNSSDIASTHPARYKRLKAVETGYNIAMAQKTISIDKTKEGLSIEYFYSGYEKDDLGDFQGAINDYNIAISLNPNFANAFNNRGLSKLNLEDYNGAISDFNQAIDLNRGNDKSLNKARALNNKGLANHYLEKYTDALSDFSQAIDLYHRSDDMVYSNRARTLMWMSEDSEDKRLISAIEDLTIAISIKSNYAPHFVDRGMCKFRSLGWDEACNDFFIAQALGEDIPEIALEYLKAYPCE